MNRQEAIDRLKKEVERIEEIMENGDFGCVDVDTWNEFAKKAEWRETLIELLSGPAPDHDTGLVDCGCGEKPNRSMLFSCPPKYKVECVCGVQTAIHKDPWDAENNWNRAMGYEDTLSPSTLEGPG